MSSLLKVMNYVLEVLISSERVEIDKQKGAKTYIAQAVSPYNSANQPPLRWSLHQMHSIPVNRWAYWQKPCRYLRREWMQGESNTHHDLSQSSLISIVLINMYSLSPSHINCHPRILTYCSIEPYTKHSSQNASDKLLMLRKCWYMPFKV